MQRLLQSRPSRALLSVLLVMLTVPMVALVSAQPVFAAAKPCAATGLDPVKKAIHVSKSGKPKKLKEDENSGKLFGKARVDRQDEDQERSWGEIVHIAGFSTTVASAGFVESTGQFEDAGYVKLSVKSCNRNDDAQGAGALDWRLQTPTGQVLDPTIIVQAPTLSYVPVDLVKGGEVAGDVYFESGGLTGDFYAIYKPDPLDESRGIWKVPI
jgi:hypothetical protein